MTFGELIDGSEKAVKDIARFAGTVKTWKGLVAESASAAQVPPPQSDASGGAYRGAMSGFMQV